MHAFLVIVSSPIGFGRYMGHWSQCKPLTVKVVGLIPETICFLFYFLVTVFFSLLKFFNQACAWFTKIISGKVCVCTYLHTVFFMFLAKGKALTWSSTWSEIQISQVSKAFKKKNNLYLTVSNISKDCWYVVSHVSFASSNYESHVWSCLCFDFHQKPEKHGIYLSLSVRTNPREQTILVAKATLIQEI